MVPVGCRQVNRYSAANARAFAGSTVSQEDLEKEREASQKRKAAEENELAQLLEDCGCGRPVQIYDIL